MPFPLPSTLATTYRGLSYTQVSLFSRPFLLIEHLSYLHYFAILWVTSRLIVVRFSPPTCTFSLTSFSFTVFRVRTSFTCELRTDFWNNIIEDHHLVCLGLPLKVIDPTIQIWNLYEQAFIIVRGFKPYIFFQTQNVNV